MLDLKAHKNGINAGTLDRCAHYAAYLYISLPIIIFIFGWIKWYISVPLGLIVIYSFSRCFIRRNDDLPLKEKVPGSALFAVLLIVCCWAWISGVGGYVFQNYDHYYRNEIFRVLVRESWPPTKTILTNAGYLTTFVSYYIGFWLPAALVGKIFGLEAGYLFQLVWAVIGILLIFAFISKRIGKWNVSSILVFAFFSGLDIAGCALVGNDIFSISMQDHIELWSGYQYSSHMTQLFWVFNQAIYGWLLTLMILDEKENRHLILFWSCGLLECTFPFVGMIPFLIYRIISNINREIPIKKLFKWSNGLFSVENVLGGGIIGIISFLYLFGNSSAQSAGAGFGKMKPADLFALILFVMIEAGVYFIAIGRYQKKNPLFYISMIVLALCPFIRVGGSLDFCMRASIPALLVLCVLVTESMHMAWKENRRRFYAILCVFLIGSVTAVHEVFRTTVNTFRMHASGEEIRQYIDEKSMFDGGNFSASARDSLFAKYLTNVREQWQYGRIDASGGVIGEIAKDRMVEQCFETQEDITISSIHVKFATYVRNNNCNLDVYILDEEGGTVQLAAVDCSTLSDNAIYSIYFDPYEIQKGKRYTIRFTSPDASEENAVTIYRSADESQEWQYAVIDGQIQDYDLAVGLGQ